MSGLLPCFSHISASRDVDYLGITLPIFLLRSIDPSVLANLMTLGEDLAQALGTSRDEMLQESSDDRALRFRHSGLLWGDGATGMNARPAVRCPQQPKLGSSAYRISRPQVTQPTEGTFQRARRSNSRRKVYPEAGRSRASRSISRSISTAFRW